jgi:hypothetical protein
MTPVLRYAEADARVARAMADGIGPYLIARAAVQRLRFRLGARKAAELIYAMADEMVGEGE